MKRILGLCMAFLLISTLVFAGGDKEKSALEEAAQAENQVVIETPVGTLDAPEELIDRFSYAFGYLFTQSYMADGVEFNADYFTQGMREAIAGNAGIYSQDEINSILMEYQTVLMEQEQAAQAEISAANLEEAETFLATNKTRAGVTTTDSGLQYEVVVEGDGEKPTADDVVTVHYKGSFLDGNVFESSYDSGTPATFALGGVIDGWVEGVQLMSVGSKYRFFLHPDLAYGETGSAPVIGPSQLLIFEVELLSIGDGE